ncbi:ERF family protein [Paenibacillus cisolokensis]|nr:ERF family protein [Paenibacillus cisolokensis]
MVAVMSEVGQLRKDGSVTDRNGKKMYDYLSEEQTTGELQAAFIKHNLVIFPVKVEEDFFYIETFQYDKEIKAPITKVKVTYQICDAETGESIEVQSIGYGSDNQDKGSNKAMTGAFKYMQRQTFMISTGDDGDHTASDVLNAQYSRSATQQGQQQAQGTQYTNRRAQSTTGQNTAPDTVSEAQLKMIGRLKNERQINDADYRELLQAMYNVESTKQLTKKQASEFIAYLQKSA